MAFNYIFSGWPNFYLESVCEINILIMLKVKKRIDFILKKN